MSVGRAIGFLLIGFGLGVVVARLYERIDEERKASAERLADSISRRLETLEVSHSAPALRAKA